MLIRTAWNVPLLFDEEISEKNKRKRKRINIAIAVFIALTTIYEAIFNLKSSFISDKIWKAYSNFDDIAEGLFLIGSVLYLRQKINQVENLHTNLKLILVHIANFIVYSLLVTVD